MASDWTNAESGGGPPEDSYRSPPGVFVSGRTGRATWPDLGVGLALAIVPQPPTAARFLYQEAPGFVWQHLAQRVEGIQQAHLKSIS